MDVAYKYEQAASELAQSHACRWPPLGQWAEGRASCQGRKNVSSHRRDSRSMTSSLGGGSWAATLKAAPSE